MNNFKDAKFVFVIGIGGSDLAAKAVWQAMSLHKQNDKKVLFLEAPDEREYAEVTDLVENDISDLGDLAVITVSKSGQTTETLATFHKVFDLCVNKFGSLINEKMLVISMKDTTLAQLAREKNINFLEWEGDVGGRFSAFTVAHTAVLSVLGLDTDGFLAGSKRLNTDGARHLAKEIFENYKKEINILDFFIFNSELEDLGKWCRQLIAESIALITPTVSLGPTDLHSMLELYLGGPKNRFTVFLRSLDEIDTTVNEKAYQNVVKAYERANLPFMTYEIKKIEEQAIGEFIAFMIETTLELARLLDVNPYDQPAVENYKKSLHNL